MSKRLNKRSLAESYFRNFTQCLCKWFGISAHSARQQKWKHKQKKNKHYKYFTETEHTILPVGRRTELTVKLNGIVRICVNKWRFLPSDSRIFDAGHFPPAGKFAHVVVDTNVSSCWRSESKDNRETATSGGQKTHYASYGCRPFWTDYLTHSLWQ